MWLEQQFNFSWFFPATTLVFLSASLVPRVHAEIARALAKGASDPFTLQVSGKEEDSVVREDDRNALRPVWDIDWLNAKAYGIIPSFEVLPNGRYLTPDEQIVGTVSGHHSDLAKHFSQMRVGETQDKSDIQVSANIGSKQDERVVGLDISQAFRPVLQEDGPPYKYPETSLNCEEPVSISSDKDVAPTVQDQSTGGGGESECPLLLSKEFFPSPMPPFISDCAKVKPDFEIAIKTYTDALERFKAVYQDLTKALDLVLANSDLTRYPQQAFSVKSEREATLSTTRDLSEKHGIMFDELAETLNIEQAYMKISLNRNEKLKPLYDELRMYVDQAEEAYKIALGKITRVSVDSKISGPTWKSKLSLSKYMETRMPGFESSAPLLMDLERATDSYEGMRRGVVIKARAFYGKNYDPTGNQKTWMQHLDEEIEKFTEQDKKENSKGEADPMRVKDIEFKIAGKHGPKSVEFESELKKTEMAKERMRQARTKYDTLYNNTISIGYGKLKDAFTIYQEYYNVVVEIERVSRRINQKLYELAISTYLSSNSSGLHTVMETLDQLRIASLDMAASHFIQGVPISPVDAQILGRQSFIDGQAEKNLEVKELQDLADVAKRDLNNKIQTL